MGEYNLDSLAFSYGVSLVIIIVLSLLSFSSQVLGVAATSLGKFS